MTSCSNDSSDETASDVTDDDETSEGAPKVQNLQIGDSEMKGDGDNGNGPPVAPKKQPVLDTTDRKPKSIKYYPNLFRRENYIFRCTLYCHN